MFKLFLRLQNRIARERDQGIQNMQQGIHEIHGIFKDIAGMVTEQGQTIQTIENHAMDSLANTQKGREELEKAHKKAQANRKNAVIVLVVALLMLLFMWWMGRSPAPAVIEPSPPPAPPPESLGDPDMGMGSGQFGSGQ